MTVVKTYKGFHPYYHQKVVIDNLKDSSGTGKIVVCKSSRQKGKSTLIANLLLYFSINYSNTNNYCLSPSLKQAKNIFKNIVNAIQNSGVMKSKNATDLIITLVNGSTINFKSAEQRDSLRGYTADFICIDESAFIPDEIFYLILPWSDAKKAPILMVSTPLRKSGFFFKYFQYGLENSHNTTTIDWSSDEFKESIQQILPPEKLDEYRKVLPKNVFCSEYLGEWLDDDGTVFTNLFKCLKENIIKPEDKLFFGIDWSNQNENDYTVLTAFNQSGEQVYLKYFNKLSPLRQIDLICKELEPYAAQIDVIACESNSIGIPYIDALKYKSQILSQKIQMFTTTNTSKNAIVTNMQIALESEQVHLLPDEMLKQQFGYFTATFNPKTRNVSYAAPNGLHDDIVMATLIAYDAYKNKNNTGKYFLR